MNKKQKLKLDYKILYKSINGHSSSIYENSLITTNTHANKDHLSCNRNTNRKFLKTLDNFSNCQRPVVSLGVSQHMHKIMNL